MVDMEWLTSHDPKLPEHDEGASNSSRGHLSRVDRNSGVLGTNTDSHNEPRNEQAFPSLREARANRGRSETESSEEDLASSAKVVVQRIDDESTTVCSSQLSIQEKRDSETSTDNVLT
jgi:hypothetical protein